MTGDPLIWSVVAQAAWVAPVALGAALAAEALGQPRIVGAMVAGLLLGTGVLGQLAPHLHQRLVTGGHHERRALQQYEHEQNELLVMLMQRGYDDRGAKVFQDSAVAGIELRQRALDRAVAHRDRARTILMLLAAAALVLAGGLALAEPRPAPQLTGAGLAALGAAVTVALFSAGAVLLLNHWLTSAEAVVGGWALAAVALAAGLPIHAKLEPLTPGDDTPALHAATVRWLALGAWAAAAALIAEYERRYQSLGVLVFTVCVVTIGMHTAHLLRRKIAEAFARDAVSLTLILALAAAGAWTLGVHPLAALAIAALACPIATGPDAALGRRLAGLAAPVVAMMAVLRIDPAHDFNAWLLLAALIVIGDGKAVGAWLAARGLARRDGLAALHLGAATCAGGALLLIVAWLLHARRIIDGPVYTAVVLAELIVMLLYRPVLAMAAAMREAGHAPAD